MHAVRLICSRVVGGVGGRVENVNFKRSCRAPVKKPGYTGFPFYFGTCRRDLKKKK